MSAQNYTTSMSLQEKNYYINKFRMKMTGCLPSVAAEWIDGINKGTMSDMRDIYYEVRNDIDWTSPDPQRAKGDMPVWTRDHLIKSLKGFTYNSKGEKVRVSIPAREEELPDDENPAFLYSNTWTCILVKIASGEIDANYLARVELAKRGLDINGTWVGFKAAAKSNNIL